MGFSPGFVAQVGKISDAGGINYHPIAAAESTGKKQRDYSSY